MINVLLVDDEVNKSNKIKDCINSLGIDINLHLYDNLADCVNFLSGNVFVDLLILDLNLPVRRGESARKNSGKRFLKSTLRDPKLTRPQQIIGITSFENLLDEYSSDFQSEGWTLVEFKYNSSAWEETIINKIVYINSNKTKEKMKILFFSSMPDKEVPLSLGRESRIIKEVIDSSSFRDTVSYSQVHGSKLITFTGELLKTKPDILHYSGHGCDEGIVLETDSGTAHLIPNKALERLFKAVGKLQCIIMNSCYSSSQAENISKNGYYVIGMNESISDISAISFSKGFYQSLLETNNIELAFNIGVVHLMAEVPEEEFIPQLWLDGEEISFGK